MASRTKRTGRDPIARTIRVESALDLEIEQRLPLRLRGPGKCSHRVDYILREWLRGQAPLPAVAHTTPALQETGS